MCLHLCQTPQEFDAWDEFVVRFPGAHYCQLYGWLSSYEAMGFECEVMVQSEGDRIVGGAAFVSIAIPFFAGRIFILPHGPLSDTPGGASWDMLMEALAEHFRGREAVYVQAWPPVACDDMHGLEHFVKAGYQGPALFKSHRFSSTLLAVDLVDRSEEEILAGFRRQTRYSCRKSLQTGLTLHVSKRLADLRCSYELLEANARYHGYRPRPYQSLVLAFQRLITKDRGMLIQARKGNELAGTLLVLFAGRIATYYAGATQREFRQCRPAEFMQLSAIRLAKERGMEIYDLMNWSTGGVAEFKRGFRPREYRWADPRTKMFKPAFARCLSWGENRLRPLARRLVRLRATRTSHFQHQ